MTESEQTGVLTFIKLGGSLITDKRLESSFRAEVMTRIAREIVAAHLQTPEQQLIIGHGSGSFGHVVAKRYDTIAGVNTPEAWRGFAEVAASAAALNTLVTATLRDAGLPVIRFQPSASAIADRGHIISLALDPVRRAYTQGLIPLIYGDVAFDDTLGGTIISTETVFTYLAMNLPVNTILLVGEVPGVYDVNGMVISEITPDSLDSVREALGESRGTDVTGGMLTKVSDMVGLVERFPAIRVRIIDGTAEDTVVRALRHETGFGTLIHAGKHVSQQR